MFKMTNDWFSGECLIKTYQLEELLGTKLRALYQRQKGRDLFDLYYAGQKLKLNYDDLIHCYRKYMEYAVKKSPTQRQFLLNLEKKIDSPIFNGDMEGLLKPDFQYDPKEAFDWVKDNLLIKI